MPLQSFLLYKYRLAWCPEIHHGAEFQRVASVRSRLICLLQSFLNCILEASVDPLNTIFRHDFQEDCIEAQRYLPEGVLVSAPVHGIGDFRVYYRGHGRRV